MVYRSKIDTWLFAILMAAGVIAGFASFRSLMSATSAWWVVAITLGVGLGLPAWVLASTFYILEPRQLIVRSGPFKWRIPLSDITGISPTSNPLSSPALSLDRLRIEYGGAGSIMISPVNKEQFLRDIEALRREAI